MQLPEQHTPVGQPTSDADRRLAYAVEEAIVKELAKTFHRDTAPLPSVGATPPVPQPGRPPMSQKATDASALMLAGGAATVMVSGSAAGLMYFSQFADPVACAIVLGAPVALVVAVTRLVAKARATAPQSVTQHFHGTVTHDERTINADTRSVWSRTANHH